MIAREMIAEKVFAESVAKDIRNFLPEKYENAEFHVMQMNKKGIWISCVANVCRRKYKDTATCGLHNQKRSQCIS